jgi:hypothetical protein
MSSVVNLAAISRGEICSLAELAEERSAKGKCCQEKEVSIKRDEETEMKRGRGLKAKRCQE